VFWLVGLLAAIGITAGFLVSGAPTKASGDAPPEVVTVPLHGVHLTIPHDAWIGKEIVFKGTAHDPDGDATMVEYKWDFGDGYSTGWTPGVNAYVIEAKHTYTGTMLDGFPYGPGRYFTAWLYVKDNTGLVGQDSYFVAIRDKTLAVEVNVAVDNGLWWLHKQQMRGTYPDGAGYGYWDNGYYDVAATAAAVEAFELRGHLPKGDPYDIRADPYVETVQRGLNYLFNHMEARSIGQDPSYCPLGNPDTNGNGIGLTCYTGHFPGHPPSTEIYEAGVTLMTMGSSKAPDRVATTGPVAGRTYLEITQDMVDFLAWGQSDPYTGNNRGGWRYYANYPGSDNSVSQWPGIGMEAAERNMGGYGLTVPSFVKPELLKWLTYSQNPSNGGFGYTWPGEWVNTAKTGAGAAMLSWAGVPVSDPRFQNALSFLNTHWYDSGWSYTNFGDYYTMYAIMKGMRIPDPDDVELIGSHDWYAEYARYIVDDQNVYGGEYLVDHSWLGSGQRSDWDGNVHDTLATAWAMLTLTLTVTEAGPVADAGPDVERVRPTLPIKFDGSGSYHMAYPDKMIVRYCWDFGDGSPEECSDMPTAPTAEHAYPAFYNPDGSINWGLTAEDYTVTLRVIDNNDPPRQDEDTCVVHITEPPWKPVANANGPYEGGRNEAVQLDGSGSYHPGQTLDPSDPWYETIATYEWDLDNDGAFDDSTEINPIWSWDAAGSYGVCLKVTDSAPSGPGGTVGDNDVDIDCAAVKIGNRNPIANAGGPYPLRPDMTVEVDGSGSWDPDGDPLSYHWDCQSDGIWDTLWSSSPLATCTYPERREYMVTLQVEDGQEAYDEDQTLVLPDADVKIVDQYIVDPPTEIDVSVNTPVTLRKVLHNNGPLGPVDVSDTLTTSAPADCTVTPSSVGWVAELPVSVDVTRDSNFTIHCSGPSTHTFTFDDSVTVTTPGVVDPDLTNNSESTELTVNALADVDVAVTQTIVSPPAEIDVSSNVVITLQKTITATVLNQQPYNIPSVAVTVTKTASAPAGCTVTPTSGVVQKVVSTTTPLVFQEQFTIHCSGPSTHGPFIFQNVVSGPKDAHVSDPNAGNNTARSELTVDAIAYADLKVTAQYVENQPTEIPVSGDVAIVLIKVLHNNGPWGPVNAQTETDVTAPPDCTVSPGTHIQRFWNLPVSVDILHHEPFVIHCSEPSQHTFEFDDVVHLTDDPHIRDVVPGNDGKITNFTVDAVAQADIKITSVGFVNPPDTLPLGVNVDITLRKHVHNNGPWTPVDIAIAAAAAAPTGCTVVAKNVPTSLTNVPVSVDQVVDEVWTIRCTEEGFKTFVFDNSLDVATPHVSDPNPSNNSSHKLLSVMDDASADADLDGDGLNDAVDPCVSFPDCDADSVLDGLDNCPLVKNASQADFDVDGIGDACDPSDADGDGFRDAVELYLPTDPRAVCAGPSHDAWPLDVNMDGRVTVVGDVLAYAGRIGAAAGPPPSANWRQRLDLNADNSLSVVGDVLKFAGKIGVTCS
jgi:hypothetical protein